ncbi:MAG: heme-binding protein [Ktedonobacteraceae bacterium]|nr:heme-binding protein [Ktedonobacteraceae bacterium]
MSISVELARKVMEASKRRARELRSPVSIAIVDAGGHLVLFERMMAPYGWATGNISIAKATTAVMFNQSTNAVAQWGSGIPGFASSLAAMTSGKFIMAAGGWPIRIEGATIGGIGVSGGNAPGRDDEIAHAGLAAIEAAVVPYPASPVAPGQSFSGIPVSPLPSPSAPVYMPQAAYPFERQQSEHAGAFNPSGKSTPDTRHLPRDGEKGYSGESFDQPPPEQPAELSGDHS